MTVAAEVSGPWAGPHRSEFESREGVTDLPVQKLADCLWVTEESWGGGAKDDYTHLPRVPRLRVSGDIPPVPHTFHDLHRDKFSFLCLRYEAVMTSV
jgi:hypothetical protein